MNSISVAVKEYSTKKCFYESEKLLYENRESTTKDFDRIYKEIINNINDFKDKEFCIEVHIDKKDKMFGRAVLFDIEDNIEKLKDKIKLVLKTWSLSAFMLFEKNKYLPA